MYNVTTIGLGLGFETSRLLAWGLGSWIEVVVEIPSYGYIKPAEWGEKPERFIVIRIRFGRLFVEKRYKLADRLIRVLAWFIGIRRAKGMKSPVVEARLWNR